eukprot:NODE_10823_length_1326_cov_4.955796.p1 GENE.NODE_10823_length_1326_cov_4.955796~~NODE_10823_length_1326_cov_4.955796.p1  ORF type:complete len:256 (-),score=42.22 NODE_10823_length_1326_cov_4.955796:458-1225(-)
MMGESACFSSSPLGMKQHQLNYRASDQKNVVPLSQVVFDRLPSPDGMCVLDLDDIDDEEPLTMMLLLQEDAKPANLATPRHEQKQTSVPGAPTREVGTLAHAIRSNDVDDVRTVLESDPSAAVMPIIECGLDPVLCHALRFDVAVPIIELLLKYNASVDATDREGRTPLAVLVAMPIRVASRCERGLAIAGLLLAAGANAEVLDTRGRSPLALAIEVGNWHFAARLINGTTPMEGLPLPAPPPPPPAWPELPQRV